MQGVLDLAHHCRHVEFTFHANSATSEFFFNLKDANATTQPWLAPCAPTCTTIQYKSLTRQHIESLGFDIVANFGDQFSDLNGGFADQTFKVPNPMYFLP